MHEDAKITSVKAYLESNTQPPSLKWQRKKTKNHVIQMESSTLNMSKDIFYK